MANAAYMLAAKLEEWAVPKGTPTERHRGFSNINDLDAWREQQRACELIGTVDRLLAGMDANGDNPEMFLSTLPKWYAGIHFATTPWGKTETNRATPCCTEIEINLLRALGKILDTDQETWELDEDGRRTLADVLDQAKQLIAADDTMPVDIRRYVWSLIARAYNVVEHYDTFGPDATRQIALELGGAMVARGEVVEKSGNGGLATKWKSYAAWLVTGILSGATTGAGNQLAHEALKQLPGGK